MYISLICDLFAVASLVVINESVLSYVFSLMDLLCGERVDVLIEVAREVFDGVFFLI